METAETNEATPSGKSVNKISNRAKDSHVTSYRFTRGMGQSACISKPVHTPTVESHPLWILIF